jgi:hypothetical protein
MFTCNFSAVVVRYQHFRTAWYLCSGWTMGAVFFSELLAPIHES